LNKWIKNHFCVMSFWKFKKSIRIQVNLPVAEIISNIYTKKWENTSHYELKTNPKKGWIQKMGKYTRLWIKKHPKKWINIPQQQLKNTPKGNFAASLVHIRLLDTLKMYQNLGNIFGTKYYLVHSHQKMGISTRKWELHPITNWKIPKKNGWIYPINNWKRVQNAIFLLPYYIFVFWKR
jgi:hypothetical protein